MFLPPIPSVGAVANGKLPILSSGKKAQKTKAVNVNAIWRWQQLCKYIKTISQKTSRKISWTAQINYNSAIHVINSDQIKCLPPSWIETLDFIQVSTCQPSKRVVQAEIPPPTRHPLLSIFMTQSNLKRAQADIYVGNKNRNIFTLLFCMVVSKGGQKGATDTAEKFFWS